MRGRSTSGGGSRPRSRRREIRLLTAVRSGEAELMKIPLLAIPGFLASAACGPDDNRGRCGAVIVAQFTRCLVSNPLQNTPTFRRKPTEVGHDRRVTTTTFLHSGLCTSRCRMRPPTLPVAPSNIAVYSDFATEGSEVKSSRSWSVPITHASRFADRRRWQMAVRMTIGIGAAVRE